MKKQILILSSLFLISLFFLAKNKTEIKNPDSKNTAENISDVQSPPRKTPEVVNNITLAEEVPPSKKEQKSSQNTVIQPDVAKAMPTLVNFRAQAKANPHETPASFVNFATLVAERLDDAKGNKTKAQKLFAELERCVLTRDSDRKIIAVQAFCAEVAKKLSEQNNMNDAWYALYKIMPKELEIMLAPLK